MSKFIFRILQYVILLGLVISIYVGIIYLKPNFVDYYYYRFTTDKSSSMIMGASRAAQGIIPSIVNEDICTEENRMINHAFALGPGNFGPNYYKEIKQKIKPGTKNGVFIFSVCPWTLATNSINTKDDSLLFFEYEQGFFVGTMRSSSTNPNLEYLWNHWTNKFSVFENAYKSVTNYHRMIELQKDGWLKVNINMDSVSLNNRITKGLLGFSQDSTKYMWSDTRYQYLKKMVNYCSKRGEVYLVRMPITRQLADLELKYDPKFDDKMMNIAREFDIPYFNFIGESGKYKTTDTHHLYKEEAKIVTRRICDSIATYKNAQQVVISQYNSIY